MIRFSQQKPVGIGDVNLTPMIDIIFNLLIFFLIVAVVSQKGLNLALPETSTAEKRPPKSLEITVTKDRRILFDGAEVPEADLEARLRREKDAEAEDARKNIVLKADKEAPFGAFVVVMDTARRVGLKNLVIATKLDPNKAGGSP